MFGVVLNGSAHRLPLADEEVVAVHVILPAVRVERAVDGGVDEGIRRQCDLCDLGPRRGGQWSGRVRLSLVGVGIDVQGLLLPPCCHLGWVEVPCRHKQEGNHQSGDARGPVGGGDHAGVALAGICLECLS